MTEGTHINNIVDVKTQIADKDPDWDSPAFSRALSDALFYGFRMQDSDVIMLKWKMLGHLYDSNPSLQSADNGRNHREDYQSREMWCWISEQHKQMRNKDEAAKYASQPMSKEEAIGRGMK